MLLMVNHPTDRMFLTASAVVVGRLVCVVVAAVVVEIVSVRGGLEDCDVGNVVEAGVVVGLVLGVVVLSVVVAVGSGLATNITSRMFDMSLLAPL